MSLVCPSAIAAIDAGLCASVDIYCERTSAASDAEPINALTNIAFPLAAWAAWRLSSKHANPVTSTMVNVLIATIAIVGLGSFLFHTIATRWGEWGDVIPILVFVVLYFWLLLSRFFRWSFWPTFLALSLFLTLTLFAEARVPPEVLWGGAMYLPTLFAIVAMSVALYHQEPDMGRSLLVAAGVFICSFAARTVDMQVCTAFPLGTHFFWHLLNALLLYLLVRLAILKPPTHHEAASQRRVAIHGGQRAPAKARAPDCLPVLPAD
jgi:hypothetical protein